MTDINRDYITELLEILDYNHGYDSEGGYFYSKIGNLIAKTINGQTSIKNFQEEATKLSNTIEENIDSELLTSYIAEIQNNPINSYNSIAESLKNDVIATKAREYLLKVMRAHDAYSSRLLLINEECEEGSHPELKPSAYTFVWNACVPDDILPVTGESILEF